MQASSGGGLANGGALRRKVAKKCNLVAVRKDDKQEERIEIE